MMFDPDQDITMGMPKMLAAGDLGADKFEGKMKMGDGRVIG